MYHLIVDEHCNDGSYNRTKDKGVADLSVLMQEIDESLLLVGSKLAKHPNSIQVTVSYIHKSPVNKSTQ